MELIQDSTSHISIRSGIVMHIDLHTKCSSMYQAAHVPLSHNQHFRSDRPAKTTHTCRPPMVRSFTAPPCIGGSRH